ncbi:tetratricopeptide repeat protein, partial [Necator americanus]
MWDCMIDCFKQLGKLEKAEALIRRLLLERPNDSMLYCYLGDITMEASYYDAAIKMSNDHNSRARKSFGFLMLLRNQFDSAYKHLRRSLELQPIQVSFEPEHFEAWNNLSAAYIKLGQKDRARRILQEALKFNYEHPKVWENYLLLCVDTAQFDQAIKAFHRLLDLNKQQQDDEILDIIATRVLKICDEFTLCLQVGSDETTTEAVILKTELIKLFGRLSAVQTMSSKMWKCYASLKKPKNNNVEEVEKYIKLLERALLADSNKPDWKKDATLSCSVLSSALELAGERLRFASIKGEDSVKQTKARVRISLRPIVTIAEKEYGQ